MGKGQILVVGGAVGVAVAAFLPWGGSGRADRTSFELVSLARRLDVLDGAAASLAPAWYAVPLVAAL
ncbi:MAG: hypothetical protein ACRD0G_09840, partial [Acidimicrobiales bacterium]